MPGPAPRPDRLAQFQEQFAGNGHDRDAVEVHRLHVDHVRFRALPGSLFRRDPQPLLHDPVDAFVPAPGGGV